jgi:hypothetical protein
MDSKEDHGSVGTCSAEGVCEDLGLTSSKQRDFVLSGIPKEEITSSFAEVAVSRTLLAMTDEVSIPKDWKTREAEPPKQDEGKEESPTTKQTLVTFKCLQNPSTGIWEVEETNKRVKRRRPGKRIKS